jgi:gamma-glutamyltranspeptidase
MPNRQGGVAVLVVLVGIVHLSAQTTSWRPTIVAQHGIVAAGHPLAAEAGMRILKAGGNAVDAAMATWAVQGEVEPGMTGLVDRNS